MAKINNANHNNWNYSNGRAARISYPEIHHIIYPDSDEQPMTDNTEQFELIVGIK